MQTVTPPTQQQHSLARLFAVSAVLLACAAATASCQQLSPDGHISPPSSAPDFNPAAWNRAYKLLLRNVPSAQYSSREVLQSLKFPHTMLSTLQLPQDCASEGFDTTAAASVQLVSWAPLPQSLKAHSFGMLALSHALLAF